MYDEDPPEVAPIEVKRIATQLPRLEWTSRGYPCWAEFRDADELSGRDLRGLRKVTGDSDNKGVQANDLYAEVLRLLVARWEIGYAPTLSTPGESRNPAAILEQLSALDLRKLEQYVTPLGMTLARGDELPEDGFNSPPRPARG